MRLHVETPSVLNRDGGNFSGRMDVELHSARMSFLSGALGVLARSPVERPIMTLLVSFHLVTEEV